MQFYCKAWELIPYPAHRLQKTVHRPWISLGLSTLGITYKPTAYQTTGPCKQCKQKVTHYSPWVFSTLEVQSDDISLRLLSFFMWSWLSLSQEGNKWKWELEMKRYSSRCLVPASLKHNTAVQSEVGGSVQTIFHLTATEDTRQVFKKFFVFLLCAHVYREMSCIFE